MKRFGSRVLVFGLLLTGLLGCSSSQPTATGPDRPSSSSSSTSPAPLAPDSAPEKAEQETGAEASIEPAVFTGPAVERYGQESLQEAYRVVSSHSVNALDEEMFETSHPSVQDFERFTKHLTPSAKADFEANLNEALTTYAAEAKNNVYMVASYDLYGGTSITERSDSPAVTNLIISKASAALTNDGRLNMTATTTADFNINIDGQPVTIQHTKVTTFTLKKDDSTGGKWLIDGFRGEIDNSDPVPVKAAG